MSLLPSWVTRVAQEVTDYVQTFLAPSPEKIAVTSDHAAEKMLKAMEKAATTGTASGLHGLVRGAKKLIDYENGAFYMPRLVRVLADGLATPPAEETQASATYRKDASLLMEQGCRTMVSESMSTYKAMAETGDDPLAAKNISENMQLVLEVSTNEKQLARALALSTGAIKMMRHHGDVAGTSAAVSGVRTVLTEKAHPKARDLKSHFERFLSRLYKRADGPAPGFSLDIEVLTAEHQAAFAAARQRRAPLPEQPVKPPVSAMYQSQVTHDADSRAITEAFDAPPAAAIATPPVRPAFVRAVVTPEVDVPEAGPEDKGLTMSFSLLTPQPKVPVMPRTIDSESRAYPHGRITDQGIYATKPTLRDDFTTTSVNDKFVRPEAAHEQPLDLPELQLPARPIPPAVLEKMVGVFRWNSARQAFDKVASGQRPRPMQLHDDSLLELPELAPASIPASGSAALVRKVAFG